MEPMKPFSTSLNCLAECFGEIRSIEISAVNGEFVGCWKDGDLDDGIDGWDEFKARYGIEYWDTLDDLKSHNHEGTSKIFDFWLDCHQIDYKEALDRDAKMRARLSKDPSKSKIVDTRKKPQYKPKPRKGRK